MRQPDALDYALITAVTALTYVHWPGRHALHERLLGHFAFAIALADGMIVELSESATRYYLIAVVVLGVAFFLILTEVLPRLSGNAMKSPERRE